MLFLEWLQATEPLQELGSAYVTCSSDLYTVGLLAVPQKHSLQWLMDQPGQDYLRKALLLNLQYSLPSQQMHSKTNKRKLSS